MKKGEKEKARKLRLKGQSIGSISKELKVAKSSVSNWVRDIVLTKRQKEKLTQNGFSVSAVEKRRTNRINNTLLKHKVVVDRAKEDIISLSTNDLFLIGVALYWGEGNKASRNVAGFANSDPVMMRIIMRFFREVCNVREDKFRGQIHTFLHTDIKSTERYWSKVSGVPVEQFYKTYTKPSSASKGKRDKLPHGTFQIYINDTNVLLAIKGWIEKIKELGDIEHV